MSHRPFASYVAEILETIDLATRALKYELDVAQKSGLGSHLAFFAECKDYYEQIDTARKQIYHLLNNEDRVRIPARFEEQDTDRMRVPEAAKSFSVQTKYSASIPKETRSEALEWLAENAPELITETVNSSSLAAFLKDRLVNEGLPAPNSIKFNAYKTIGAVKYNPKGKAE